MTIKITASKNNRRKNYISAVAWPYFAVNQFRGILKTHPSDRGTDRIILFWVPTGRLSMPLKRGPFSAHRGPFEGPQE